MKTIDSEKIITLIHAQARSADLWVTQWQRYKDISGVRNAALAIGKIFGLFNVLTTMNGMDEDVPEDIMELMQKYSTIWDNLTISREFAAAHSVHG